MGVVLVVAGSFIAFAGLAFSSVVIPHLTAFLRYRHLEWNGVAGEAVCVAHAPTADARTKVFLDIRVQGEEGRTVRMSERQYPPPVAVGEVRPVVYDRRDPRRAKIGVAGVDFGSRSELGVARRLLLVGLPVFALGALLVVIA
ncbi:hypothetical protein GCM10020367_37590 [Streptomyces sannanensis]|uniref:DUF3592 domain-containing protein n=1 Tax=Streptomyces sannanensis TaxID=285536 RepID=A0ABP6SDS7_9ACTN